MIRRSDIRQLQQILLMRKIVAYVLVLKYLSKIQKNRLMTAGSNTFTYDDEGQLTSGYGSSYTFDYAHRLTAISYQLMADSFLHDEFGLL